MRLNPYILKKLIAGMEQLIRNLTTSFTEKLSDDKSFYTPDDLREYDIPEFLVQRVEIEIYRNLNESIVPPYSEWADMSADEVEEAWEQFIDAILAEVRMPVSFAYTIFETAIADVMDLILEPRKSIPEMLFGPQKELSIYDLEKQLPAITVNSHLAQAVYKYMVRKEIEEIDIKTARRVVIKVDERITANYNSLTWAQMLQPLFILAGPKVDTDLFRIFFRDRDMDLISTRFDLINRSLNKREFIETLSSPDLLNEQENDEDQMYRYNAKYVEETESQSDIDTPSLKDEDQQNLDTEDSEQTAPDAGGTLDDEEVNENIPDVDSELSKTDSVGQQVDEIDNTEEENKDDKSDDESIAGNFQNQEKALNDPVYEAEDLPEAKFEETENSEPEDEYDVEDKPLNNRFEDDEQSDILPEDENVGYRFADKFIYDVEGLSEIDELDEIVEIDEDNQGKSGEPQINGTDDSTEETDSFPGEEEDDSPIWQSFLGDEEHIEEDDIPQFPDFEVSDIKNTDSDSDTDIKIDADILFNEEDEEVPLIDLTVTESDVETAELMIGWLKDDEERFVSQIFGGSDKAYEEALIDLNQLENWKQASRFIEKEIFARNLVDMYDEEAVDFTDRLQAYFDEFKS